MPTKSRQSLNKKKINCDQCQFQVLDDEDSIQCDACERTLHSVCTKMDKRQYEKLLKNTSLRYECHFCDGSSEESSLSNDLLEIKTKLKQLDQLDEVTKTIQFMSSQFDTILKGVASNKKKIDSLQNENCLLREEVNSLKLSLKFLNDDRVKKDCIINGVDDKKENATEVVMDIAKIIGAEISADQVEDAYFVHNKKSNKNEASNKKSIVVKFSKKIHKDKFMAEKSKLKQNDTLRNVFINDFLCKESMELLNYAKSVKAVGYKFVFAKGSKVFVKKDEKSHLVFIKSMDDVDKILLRSSKGGASTSRRGRTALVEGDISEEEDNAFLSPN